jgi:hypothetical protein
MREEEGGGGGGRGGGGWGEKEKRNRKLKGLKRRKSEVEGKKVRLDRMWNGR